MEPVGISKTLCCDGDWIDLWSDLRCLKGFKQDFFLFQSLIFSLLYTFQEDLNCALTYMLQSGAYLAQVVKDKQQTN